MKKIAPFFLLPLSIIMLLLLAACDAAQPLQNAVASTPVDALPVSNNAPRPEIQIPTAVPEQIVQAADAEYLMLTNLYDRITPAVVNIEAEVISAVTQLVDTSRGSGFIYDGEGHIITNAHVIKDARIIRVTFNDGYVTSGEVVGLDTYSDLGVIKVDVTADRMRPLALSNSDFVRVGQRTIAIGNPFGLNSSMSVGIVSGLGRTLRSAELIDQEALRGFQNPSIIQTDTPINPGNSGGPLLNSEGDVIGVATAIRTDSGVFQGVGFAVPANTVRRVVPELIERGRVDYSWIGISVAPEELGFGVAALAEPLELPVNSGVLIRGVNAGSPAADAGLRGGDAITELRGYSLCIGGDIVVAVNDQYVDNMDELVAYLVVNTKPGDTVTLRIVRDRDTFELPVTLRNRPSQQGEVLDCLD